MAAVVLAGASVAFVYFLYRRGRANLEKDGRYGEYAPGQDGNDPNWVKGKQLLGDGPPDTHDSFRPSCQTWDEDLQLFVNAGNKAADADATGVTCFALPLKQNVPNRYVDAKGAVSWANMDDPSYPLQGGLPGHCYFWGGNGFTLKPAEAIVNRSARLCFGAGGHHFVDNTNHYSANPAVSYAQGTDEGEGPYFTVSDAVTPLTPSFCEALATYSLGQGNPGTIWAHTATSAAGDHDVDACLSLQATAIDKEFRWRPDSKTAVYRNPYTGHDVMTTLSPPITM